MHHHDTLLPIVTFAIIVSVGVLGILALVLRTFLFDEDKKPNAPQQSTSGPAQDEQLAHGYRLSSPRPSDERSVLFGIGLAAMFVAVAAIVLRRPER